MRAFEIRHRVASLLAWDGEKRHLLRMRFSRRAGARASLR
jgi:hypothetical protein